MGWFDQMGGQERIVLWAVLVLGLSLLALTTLLMRHGLLEHWDKEVLAWCHTHTTPAIRGFFKTLTPLGSLKLLGPAAVVLTVWLLRGGHGREALLFLVGFGGAVATTWGLKFLLSRHRPSAVLSPDQLPVDPSYPSAHTTQSLSFALMTWLVFVALGDGWRPGLAALLLGSALLVALSRMVLQVHYPSDVAAGALVALVWAAFVVILANHRVIF
jgi:undecaprenyl-diphosphatase